MLIIGLLSSEEEANEIRFIARVCSLENRIRFIVNIDRHKRQEKEED